MNISELVERKDILKDSVQNFEKHIGNRLKTNVTDEDIKEYLNYLFQLYDKLQSYIIILNNINNKTMITVGKAEISLGHALLISENVANKIEFIDFLLRSISNNINYKFLVEIKNKLLESYMELYSVIKEVELDINIEE